MLFLRLYMHYLMKGNPFVVALTAIGAVALSVGPFYQGLKSGDPAAIGLVLLILVGITLVLVVAIIDRRMNPDQKKKRAPARAGSRSAGAGKR
jgi:hypothetical protein